MTTHTPTTPANLARINKMFDGIMPLIENLADRWLDESEYEDINDYAPVIQKVMPKGFVITAMTKRPFGFRFHIGTSAEYSVTASRTATRWSRIK
jgi:hypothetical protein